MRSRVRFSLPACLTKIYVSKLIEDGINISEHAALKRAIYLAKKEILENMNYSNMTKTLRAIKECYNKFINECYHDLISEIKVNSKGCENNPNKLTKYTIDIDEETKDFIEGLYEKNKKELLAIFNNKTDFIRTLVGTIIAIYLIQKNEKCYNVLENCRSINILNNKLININASDKNVNKTENSAPLSKLERKIRYVNEKINVFDRKLKNIEDKLVKLKEIENIERRLDKLEKEIEKLHNKLTNLVVDFGDTNSEDNKVDIIGSLNHIIDRIVELEVEMSDLRNAVNTILNYI